MSENYWGKDAVELRYAILNWPRSPSRMLRKTAG